MSQGKRDGGIGRIICVEAAKRLNTGMYIFCQLFSLYFLCFVISISAIILKLIVKITSESKALELKSNPHVNHGTYLKDSCVS